MDSKLLLTTPTRRAFGFLRTLMLLAAVAAMALQMVWLFNGKEWYASMGWMYYLPVGTSIVALLFFFLLGQGGGEINVFADRVEGRRSLGVPFNIPMDQISEVQLASGRVALKGKDNELLLVETPLDARAGGLIWLCKAYGGWDERIWEEFSMDAQNDFQRATRHFLGEDGTPVFGDHGFLVQADEGAVVLSPTAVQTLYFPETPMFPVIGHDGSPKRIHHRAGTSGATLFQIEPSPDAVPLAALIAALNRVKLYMADWTEYMETLLENHGGNPCSPSEDQTLQGECLGYPVKIDPLG
jgi:hypothetical protein